jgi:hypothetical protein
MFKKLADMEKSGPLGGAADALSFISTHPPTKERLDRLEEKWKSESSKQEFVALKINYKDFKETLRKNLRSRSEESNKSVRR